MLFSTKKKYNIIFHLGVVLFIFIISFIINKIPDGTFIAGKDFCQFINSNNNLKPLFYTWINSAGQGNYSNSIPSFSYYLLQTILYNLGFSYANIANTLIFIFLTGSFYSFFFAVKLINKDISNNIIFLCSGIYALNIFTFSILTDPWGYTPFLIIYIFIPLLFAFFEKMIKEISVKNIILFSLIFLMATMGFSNMAFLYALLVLEVLLLIIFLALKRISFNLKTIRNAFLIFVLQLFLTIYFSLPYYLSLYIYISKISNGRMILNFIDYFKNLSSSILKIFTLNMTSGSYPYSNLYSGSNLLIILAFGYMVFLIGALFFKKNKEEKNWLHYMIAFIILFFLLMRMISPFDKINAFIYDKIPGFKLFRSPEKLFVFYPFFYLILLSLLLFYSKFSKKIITAFLIIILLIPIPFYIGDIPEYLSHKDSMGTKYAIQLPLDYYKIEEITDRDNSQLSIISLPYCGDFGGNWSNYSKWHFFGADFSALLYKRLFISANNFDNPTIETKLSFKEYNDAGIVDKEKFIALLQKFSGKYVILHKDITKDWIDESQTVYDTIKLLESDKILKQLDNNDYFTLYELADDYLMPLISSDKSGICFQKINPVEYKILIPDLKEKTTIEFHQSYDAQWKLFVTKPGSNWNEPLKYYKNTKTTESLPIEKIFEINDISYIWKKPIFDGTHQMVKDYANSWIVDPQFIRENYPKGYYIENKDGSISLEMTVYFRPQSYFYGGFIFEFSLIALGLGYFLGYSIWSKKRFELFRILK